MDLCGVDQLLNFVKLKVYGRGMGVGRGTVAPKFKLVVPRPTLPSR